MGVYDFASIHCKGYLRTGVENYIHNFSFSGIIFMHGRLNYARIIEKERNGTIKSAEK